MSPWPDTCRLVRDAFANHREGRRLFNGAYYFFFLAVFFFAFLAFFLRFAMFSPPSLYQRLPNSVDQTDY